jgi:hypothetical protein
MIRLTVLYNLKPYVDEDEFLAWRLGEHQRANASIPGVIRTDFARIDGAWPTSTPSPYRFMTTADWPDRASFERGFYDAQVQADLLKNVEMLADPIFLISEVLTSSSLEETA